MNTPYVDRLLAILGDQDPLAVQRSLVPRLRQLTADASRDELHRPEAPGKWSVAAVVRHLADNDLVHGYRMRKIVGARNARAAWPRIWSRRSADGVFSRPAISDGVSVSPTVGLSAVSSMSV